METIEASQLARLRQQLARWAGLPSFVSLALALGVDKAHGVLDGTPTQRRRRRFVPSSLLLRQQAGRRQLCCRAKESRARRLVVYFCRLLPLGNGNCRGGACSQSNAKERARGRKQGAGTARPLRSRTSASAMCWRMSSQPNALLARWLSSAVKKMLSSSILFDLPRASRA